MLQPSIRTVAQAAFLLLISIFLLPAHAGAIQADLVNSTLTGAPGDTLAFFVNISNPSPTDTIYLNGISSTAVSAFLSIDTTPFFSNAPLFLAAGDSSGPFELFDVAIDPSTPAGPYVGNFVSLSGGADGGAGTAFDDLADISFDVNVASADSAAPEPGTVMLLLAGGGLLFCAQRWRSQKP